MDVGYDRWPDRPVQPDWDLARKGMTNLSAAMRQMGYSGFRPGQKQAVEAIIQQKDCLVVLPTSTGKTAVFTLPTLAMGWGTLVFSPLVALMRDQVRGQEEKGIPAASVSSNSTPGENSDAIRRWSSGELSLLYVAPERLSNPEFRRGISMRPADMVAVDEMHCLSQWGHNFRGEYCLIGDFVKEHTPKVVCGLTATCPENVEKDVRKVLGLARAERHAHYYRRDNLVLSSYPRESDNDVLDIILQAQGPAIVYCSTRERTEEMAAFLGRNLGGKPVLHFHGALTPGTKRSHQDQFIHGDVDVIAATNAFGMGIDKPDIRAVVHSDIPGSMEALVQEVGRAGRDGKESTCVTLFSDRGVSTQKFFLEKGYPRRGDIERVYGQLTRMADRQGLVMATGKEIANLAGVDGMIVGAVMETLKAHNVLESSSSDEKIARVRQVDHDFEDERYLDWMARVEGIGVPGEGGFIEFDMEAFRKDVGLTYQTARKWFKEWASSEKIRFVDPFRGSEKRLKGDISSIDFDMLEARRKDAYEKFDLVLRYKDIPDEEKHSFIEDYFRVTNNV